MNVPNSALVKSHGCFYLRRLLVLTCLRSLGLRTFQTDREAAAALTCAGRSACLWCQVSMPNSGAKGSVPSFLA